MKKQIKIKFYALFLFCIINTGTRAQSWYPKNAEWIFNKQELLSFAAHGYTKYSVEKDTLINDTIAKLITIETIRYNGDTSLTDSAFVCETNSKVFYWNGNQFKLMYDFNLNIGDTLNNNINICGSKASPIVIDSISKINVNGQELKIQHISYTLYTEEEYGYNIPVSEQILEKIGNKDRFIYTQKCYVDEDFTYTGLRCYTDNAISYKNEWWKNYFPESGCYSLIYDTNVKNIEQNGILIYPNPTHDFITVTNTNTQDNFYVGVYNSSGQEIYNYCIEQSVTIDMSNFQPGLYFFKIYQGVITKNTFRIIKY